jgi:beta-carotene 3-hydroxylase
MHWTMYTAILVGSFFCMEGITWCTHKFIMHGFLWYLHQDHHQKSNGLFEKNDAFFIIFAIPSFSAILIGTLYKIYWLQAIGFGVMAYGFAYFLVHDVIIHQRVKWFTRSRSRYIRTLRWAHKMHHKHLQKEDGESFGMLYAAKKYRDKIKKEQDPAATSQPLSHS